MRVKREPPPPAIGGSTAGLPVPPDLREVLAEVTRDGFRSVSIGVAILFCLFIVFNLTDLPPHAVLPVVIHDVVMVLLSLVLYRATVREHIKRRWGFPVGVIFALLVQSNILLTAALLREPFYTFYLGIVLIGGASLVLSTRWVLGLVGVTYVAWAAIAASFTTPKQFSHYAFTLVAATVAGMALHLNRIRTQTRVAQLRYRDQHRRVELKAALKGAETARHDLDRMVEERTAELARAYEELQRELDDRHRLEEQRSELEGNLLQAQKLDSIGRLAGGVAHDFNNLLTVLSGNISLARRRITDDPKTLELLDEALAGAERTSELTSQLLAFGRKQILRPQTIRLSWVLHGIQKILERLAGERVTLELVLDDEAVGNVYADQGQVEQVVVNLAINACDAMPSGGRLRISLLDAPRSAEQCRDHKGALAGRYAAIVVSDTGEGMDAKTRESIFEPFFTTKSRGEGTGLGLATAHGIVSQHEGFIEVDSTPGKGSRFTVYFPVTEASAMDRVRRVTGPMAVVRGTETILVAEDEAAVRILARKILELHGYRVLTAKDGKHAL
jgi:signal transduction histidine kinase